MTTKFNLSIELFTRDVQATVDVAQALRGVADRLVKYTSQSWSPYALTGTIYASDDSKRPIGTWSVDSEATRGLTVQDSTASRRGCAACGKERDARVCPACAHDHGEPAFETLQ